MNRTIPRDLLFPFLILALAALLTPERIKIDNLVTADIGVTAPPLARLPLSFVPNAGQRDEAVHYEARAMGGDLYFTEDGVVLALPGALDVSTAGYGRGRARGKDKRQPERAAAGIAVLRMQFEGASAQPALEPGAALPGVVNYLLGNDPDQWRTGLSTYEGIHYRGLYPGIDLAYDGTQGVLKGTYTVAPGADPAQIRWRYEGASDVRLDDESGELLITLADNGSVLAEQAPVAWQEWAGERVPVAARYAIAGDGSIGFALDEYERGLALVIDPTLVYSSFLGGTSLENNVDVAVDSAGNIYVTGLTYSSDFPTANGYQATCYLEYGSCADAFVTKLSPDGQSLAYSTFLGGSSGENTYFGRGSIAVDLTGNVYVMGTTRSTDFPTVNPFQSDCAVDTFGSCHDIWVAKLLADGQSLVYSTYLGGTRDDYSSSIAVDSAGNAYVMGITHSADFPSSVNAFQSSCRLDEYGTCADGFLTKLAADGQSLVYSTYLGGSSRDWASGIAVDSVGNAYVGGSTYSSDFPTANAFQSSCQLRPDWYGECYDAYVTKLAADGQSLLYSSYLGGSSRDAVLSIAVDSAGNAYVGGFTSSIDFPTVSAFQPSCAADEYGFCRVDAFVTKLATDGQSLVYSTYLGGGTGGTGGARAYSEDQVIDIAVDEAGSAYVAGYTQSIDFPTGDALQASCHPDQYGYCYDAFVTKLAANGQSLIYSTYLGGNTVDIADAIALDSAGIAYVAGYTESTDFPTANAFQTSCTVNEYGQCYDAFVTKIDVNGASCSFSPSTAPVGSTAMGRVTANSPSQTVTGRVLWGPAYQELVNTGVGQATVTLGCAETTTDGEGRFSVDVEPGTYPLTIRYPLFADHQSGGETLAAAWAEKEIEVTISGGTSQLAPVTDFGDLVKLQVLGAETEVDAELTAQGFTGSADLPFGDNPAQPLKIDVAYTRSNNRLDLTANGQSTVSLGGQQTATITTFAYSSPGNTGNLGGYGTILGRPARLGGTVSSSEIRGSVDLCFAADTRAEADQTCFVASPPEAPLHVALTYNLPGRQLALTGSNAGPFSWYGQTVQVQSFSYSYPSDALSMQASAQLDVNGLQASMQVTGEMSGAVMHLQASGDASAQGVTVRFDRLRITASSFEARGRVWLPGQSANDNNQPPPAGTFDTSLASGTGAVSLALQGFQFAGYDTEEVRLRINSNPRAVQLTGVGRAMIGGQETVVNINGSINTGSSELAGQAEITIENARATLEVKYNWLTGAFSGSGTLVYLTWPCAGQGPAEHKISVTANNAEVRLEANSIVRVNCGNQDVEVSVVVSRQGSLASVEAGIRALFNNADGTLKFQARSDVNYVELRLFFEWRFGGSSGGNHPLFTVTPGSEPVRVLLTDSFGRRIGYDAASGQMVNEVPGASYDGIVNGVDSFTLPGIVGGYLVTLSSESDTSVVMEMSVPGSNAAATYAVTLEAGKTKTLITGMAPDENGAIQVGLAPFYYMLNLPAING